MSYKHILFDLDGTLTDSKPGILNSFHYALTYYGIDVKEEEEMNVVIGPPLAYSFEHVFGFKGEKIEEAVNKYREYFSTKGMFENTVYDGIPQSLHSLKNEGKKLYIATSKPQKFTEIILKHFDLYDLFDGISGSTMDATRSEKKDIISYLIEKYEIKNKSEILMVGDRKYDCIGAKDNLIDSLGVLYGYGSLEELQEAEATYIAKTPDEINHFVNLLQ